MIKMQKREGTGYPVNNKEHGKRNLPYNFTEHGTVYRTISVLYEYTYYFRSWVYFSKNL